VIAAPRLRDAAELCAYVLLLTSVLYVDCKHENTRDGVYGGYSGIQIFRRDGRGQIVAIVLINYQKEQQGRVDGSISIYFCFSLRFCHSIPFIPLPLFHLLFISFHRLALVSLWSSYLTHKR
jgi:hypothetical protein